MFRNRLSQAQSPYLQQHAGNPVDWREWGDEAFALAMDQDKPIFLSIGYSTCHWCHVMAHESFEHEETAALLNRTFVNIKVDREERPDIDAVYMTVCQMMTGRGGWPLTIVMTPDKKPFFAATYLPRDSRLGRLGVRELCERVNELWTADRGRLLDTAEQLIRGLQQVMEPSGLPGSEPGPDILATAETQLAESFDARHGGFGGAPKFPTAHYLLFLMRRYWRSGDDKIRRMVEATLDAMRRGGVYDHLGYGFHRYSTDDKWLLPHFEKMLYDQAMLAMAYTEAWQLFGNPAYRRTAEEIIQYVLRDMTAPEGVFYSAEDADSEGEEGRFYVFTSAEVREVLGDQDARLAHLAYGLEEQGNFVEEATGKKTGANVLHNPKPLAVMAQEAEVTPVMLETRLESIRARLYEHRSKRVRPHLDDKVLADWNGMFIAALAKAGRAFQKPEYVQAAARAADFMLENMRTGRGLLHRWRKGQAGIDGFADDYAFLIWGLLETYQANFEPKYLRAAAELMDEQIEFFWDAAAGGFFFTRQEAAELPVRHKDWLDAAQPGGNSVSLSNLLRLGRLLARGDLEEKAAQLLRASGNELSRHPSGYAFLLLGLDLAMHQGAEIVLSGEAEELAAALAPVYAPQAVVLRRDERLLDIAPYAEAMTMADGRGAAYVCRGYACERPVTDAAAFLDLLEKSRGME